MGLVLVLWSWLAFALPIQQQNVSQIAAQKREVKREQKMGVASFYHDRFEGRKTATGEVFDNEQYTAASNHFKLGSFVKVTNLANGKAVYVKVNDRMGHPGRLIDLAEVAAKELKFIGRGTAKVKIEAVSAQEGKRRILAQNLDAHPDRQANRL